MKAFITYSELEEIIRKKANKEIGLSFISPDTIEFSIVYEIKIIFKPIRKTLTLNVKLIDIVGSDIILEISKGDFIDKIAGFKGVAEIVNIILEGNDIKDLITIDQSNIRKLTIHLGCYENVAKAMETIVVNSLVFSENGMTAEIGIK